VDFLKTKIMIKQIFTWWNSQTVGTFIYTILFGKFVGKDDSDNKYYQNKKGKRWVIYKGEINASKIDSDWFSWIHYQTDKIPSENPEKKHIWQKPHKENKTGTSEAYKPNKITNKNKDFKKYESWKP
tara:strand:- start:48 stop:428 length:381 start_codon:yes stop_codon:yes gene_type:complete